MGMKYKELITSGQQKLKSNNLDPKLSSLLIDYYLNIKEEDKLNNLFFNDKIVNKYNKAIERLIKGEPIQYIIGNVNFYGYIFKVSKDVLIPRFETEELVFYAIQYINKIFDGKTSIIDIGTGSGVIGITLKKELPDCDITLTDISFKALKIAAFNASKLKVDVKIIKSDMLKEINDKYDVIISNPPYIKENDNITEIIKKNEPSIALYGGKDGLKYYKLIFKEAKRVLNKKFLIALEIDESLVNDLITLIKKHFKNDNYEFKKDMRGRTRMLFIFNDK